MPRFRGLFKVESGADGLGDAELAGREPQQVADCGYQRKEVVQISSSLYRTLEVGGR